MAIAGGCNTTESRDSIAIDPTVPPDGPESIV